MSPPGILCIADDSLIYDTGDTDEEATANYHRSLRDLLQRCKDRESIRRLTWNCAPWNWSSEQDQAFANVQRLVTEAPVLRYYDPSLDLTIQCDASQSGLGAALLQNGKPIEYASRSLTDTETRYAQIEKEMLAIVFSLERFNQYTFGRHVHIESDHKPLEMILQKPLARAPRRLQLMMMRLQKYDFTVHYERGENMHLADMLSRAYLPYNGKEVDDFESVNMVRYLPISDQRLDEIRAETRKDQCLRELSGTILVGWPEKKCATN